MDKIDKLVGVLREQLETGAQERRSPGAASVATPRVRDTSGGRENGPERPEALTIDSPVRSGAGNIRNVQRMGAEKFGALFVEMDAYRKIDPDGWTAVLTEAKKRGLA